MAFDHPTRFELIASSVKLVEMMMFVFANPVFDLVPGLLSTWASVR